jgi:hypothetical protein
MLKKMAMQRWAVKMVMPNLRGKTYDSNALARRLLEAASAGGGNKNGQAGQHWAVKQNMGSLTHAALSHWNEIKNFVQKFHWAKANELVFSSIV